MLQINQQFLQAGLFVLILILLVPGCGCRDLDQEAWDRARKTDSETSYRNYREQFPKGSFFREAGRRVVSRAFETARQKATIEDWTHFFERVAGLPVDESTANAARFQVTQVHFNQAKAVGTVGALQEFQKHFPLEFSEEVEELMAGIRWKTAQQTGTSAGWQEYLKIYPRGERALAAVQEIEAIELAQARKANTATAYFQFIKANPDGHLVQAARTELQHRRQEEFDQARSIWKIESNYEYLDRWGATHPLGREMILFQEQLIRGKLNRVSHKKNFSLQQEWKAETEGASASASSWLPELTAGTLAIQLAELSGTHIQTQEATSQIKVTGRLEALLHVYNLPEEATARRYSGARVSGTISRDGIAWEFTTEQLPPGTLDDSGLPRTEAQARRRDRERRQPADAPFHDLLYRENGFYSAWLKQQIYFQGWDWLPGLLHHPDTGIRNLALRLLEKHTGQHLGPSMAAWAVYFARCSPLLQESLSSQQSILPSARLKAIQTIRRMKALATLPLLAEFLTDDAEEVCRAAHQSLIQLTGEDCGSSPEDWLHLYQTRAEAHFPPPTTKRWHWSHDTLARDDR